jgi:recombination protein RecA
MARKSDTPAGSTMDEGRRSMLDKALGDIVKRYGDGSIMRLE